MSETSVFCVESWETLTLKDSIGLEVWALNLVDSEAFVTFHRKSGRKRRFEVPEDV